MVFRKNTLSGGATAATATATEEFSDRVQPLSHHAQGLNIAIGFPLTPILIAPTQPITLLALVTLITRIALATSITLDALITVMA